MSSTPSQMTPAGAGDWQALFSLPRSIWLPILAIFAGAIGAFFFNEWSVSNIRQRADQLTSLMAMQNDLIELRARIGDAESGQRGYLLSRDRRYLEPFDAAHQALPVVASRMRVEANTDPELLARVQKLESLRGLKIDEIRSTVSLMQQGQRDDAMVILRTGEGRLLMEVFQDEAQNLWKDLAARIELVRTRTAGDVQVSRLAFGALGLLTFVLLLVTVRLLVNDFRRQQEAHQQELGERHRLEHIVDERTAALSELTTFLQTVTEQEKADLARELHDEMGGLLTAAKMDLAWLQGRASAAEPELSVRLATLANDIDEAMDVKRRVVDNLRPALLDHFGLPVALRSYFEETCKKAGLGCTVTMHEEFAQIPQHMRIALFRIGQESLTNIVRHARASHVELACTADDADYRITIADDGIGMDRTRRGAPRSHGLAGMRHRIENLGGRFNIGANQPHGTRIEVVLPRAQVPEEA